MPIKKVLEVADSLDKLSASLRESQAADFPPGTLDKLSELLKQPETVALLRRVTEPASGETAKSKVCGACCLLGGGGGSGGSILATE